MGDDAKTFRMNISIPRDLKERMDQVGQPVNWSQTAAHAFEAKLLGLAAQKETKTMDEVIERLKAAAVLEEKEEYQAGLEAGRAWAREDASPKELRRLADLGGSAEDADQLACAAWPEIGRTHYSPTTG